MAKLDPCPICGAKATVTHLAAPWQGFDLGWMAGCPRFALNDGIHGIDEHSKKSAHPSVSAYSKDAAIELWNVRAERLRTEMEAMNDE